MDRYARAQHPYGLLCVGNLAAKQRANFQKK